MVKKRGGRRGKASETPEDQPSKPQGQVATPSTSQTTQSPPPAEQPKKQAPPPEKTPPTQVPPKSALDRGQPIQEQEKLAAPPQKTEEESGGAWTQRPPREKGMGIGVPSCGRGQSQGQARGRGQGRGRDGGVSQTAPGPAWGRGQGRGQHAGVSEVGPSQGQSWGRGQGRGRDRGVSQAGPSQGQAWGRGQASGGVQTRPIGEETTPPPIPEQTWGGAKPKTFATEQIVKPMQKLAVSERSKDPVPVAGTQGRSIKIETNHVRLDLGDLKTVYRYDVSIQPEKKPKRMFREAMELFRRAHYPQNHPSYDGQKLLYSAKKLSLIDGGDIASGSVTIGSDRDAQEFKITVTMTGTLDLSPLHNLLQKKNIGQEEAFQCVEVVFRQAYVNSFVNVGRRFYTQPTGRDFPLGAGAVMYLGGYQAAVRGERPFLNVDVAHKAFTTATPIPKLLEEMCGTRARPITDLRNFAIQRWQEEQMNDYLKGLKVVYEIPNHFKKNYKVNALAKPASVESFDHEGRMVTVEQFFQKKYHQALRYPNLPTLWVGNEKNRICVPMEYCVLKEGQPLAGSRLTGNQTSQMIKYSATSTSERKDKIQTVMAKAGHNVNPCIREFGFSIDPRFETLTGRVLNPPALEYSNGTVKPEGGIWRPKTFKKGASIGKWTVIGFGVQDRFRQGAGELATNLQNAGGSSGMIFSKPEPPFDFIDGRFQSLRSCLERKKDHDLIIVIIPNNKDSYYMVKQVAELQIGCLTQCIKSDTLFKLNDSTVKNILLKINAKMNGINHTLYQVDLITDEPCMVMGADVTHPSPQARSIPSVVAVTASCDLTATKYNISVYLQVPRKTMSEIIQDLESITLAKLKITAQRCGEPKRIYFFRDGVSDGEFDRVRDVEIAAIKRACQRYRPGYNPKLTFLVVQKRHHTRFFPTDRDSSAGDKSNNVPPGTCVDTVITDPDQSMRNFYLMSHQSIRGVGRPTKYWTLYDENNLSYDDVERLTYYLCHLYTRCNRAVSYPAPTYFAHLAADRAKGYLHKKNIDLDNLDQTMVRIKSDFAARHPMFFS